MSFKGISCAKVLSIIVLLLTFSSVRSQDYASTSDSVHHFLDSLFRFTPERALYAERIAWEERKAELMRQAETLERFSLVFPLLQKLLDDMEDNHSFFWYENTKYASNYGQLDESDVRPELMQGLESGQGVLKVERIDDVLYIRIPANSSSDDFDEMQASAQKIQNLICEKHNADISGWIIDLRLNTGGNMYPMILGIKQLLGDGVFAGVLKRNGDMEEWRLNGNTINESEKEITALQAACLPDLTRERVVLLTSEITGSSGEIVALAFLGRENTRIIGEESAGFMTSNELHRLPFGTFLLLSEGVETDRNGGVVKSILPDQVMVEGDNFNIISEDAKVKAALEWLRN